MKLGSWVKTARLGSSLTQEALAHELGLTKGNISAWENNRHNPSFAQINEIVRITGIHFPMDMTKWVDESPPVDDDNVQLLPPHENGTVPKSRRLYLKGTAQMGADGYWYDLEYPVNGGDGHIDAPTDDPLAYVIRVRGDSMFPAIRDNWLVVVEPNEALVPGLYVHVKTVDGRYMVKELLWAKDGELALHSVNQGYARLTLRPEDIEYAYYCFPLPPNKWRP